MPCAPSVNHLYLAHQPYFESSNQWILRQRKPYPTVFFLSSTRTFWKLRNEGRALRFRCFVNWTDSMTRSCVRRVRLAAQSIPIFLIVLHLGGEIDSGSTAAPQPIYACEDKDAYYARARDLKGEELRKELNRIVSAHQSLSYREVWDALKILDASDIDEPESSSGIVTIYSLRVVPKNLAGKPEGWNREHLWPRSYGLVDHVFLTDLHNIRPADVNVNSSRGNKYYGECHAGSSRCLKPATREAASDTESDKKKWAPPALVRGDIARAVMYMGVRYGFSRPGLPVLKLSDHPNMANKEMGLLSTLLDWNERDPPSREEKLRNDRICRIYQHNRNPFVDHPEYANLIWNGWHQTINLKSLPKLPYQFLINE